MTQRIGAAVVISAVAVIVLAALFIPRLTRATLTFSLVDAVSKGWVWDATIRIQNKEIRSFYQSDAGTVQLSFTGLRPGRSTIVASAPSYRAVSTPIVLRPGRNRLGHPIEMEGLLIPGLARFAIVERSGPSGLKAELRPVAAGGEAIRNHPCLNLWIGAAVSAEMKDGAPVDRPIERGATRGRTFFQGRVPWSWDGAPSADFRYTATLPSQLLTDFEARLMVVDYLVIVPDPNRSTVHDIDRVMSQSPSFADTGALRTYLDHAAAAVGFTYYTSTSWNVGRSRYRGERD